MQYYEDKEEMCDIEKITCQVLEAMIEECIKEFNKKIENQAKSIGDLGINNACIKKELEKIEILLQSSKTQLKESNAKVEIARSKKDKVEN